MSLPERIVTERLVLRCYHPSDGPIAKAAIDSNLEHLRKWMPWAMKEPSPLPVIEERLRKFAAAFRAGADWTYAIFDPAEREVLGGAGVHRRRGPDSLDLGYWLRSDLEGRGYATEAVRALTDAAARVEGVTRLEIRCDPNNARSAAVAARCGYTHVETLKANTLTPTGAPRDTMVWMRPNRPMTDESVDLKAAVEGDSGIFVLRASATTRGWNGIRYKTGLSGKNVGARQLSMNVATIPPGGVAYAHIHVDFEVMLYILQGRVRHEYGPNLELSVENVAGDFIFIEPGVPHEVCNVSATEPVMAVVARSDASEWEHIVDYPSSRRPAAGSAS